MAGNKKKGTGKPVNQRKAFKKSAGYLKPARVGTDEKPGSPYRQKVLRRQQEAAAAAANPYKWRW